MQEGEHGARRCAGVRVGAIALGVLALVVAVVAVLLSHQVTSSPGQDQGAPPVPGRAHPAPGRTAPAAGMARMSQAERALADRPMVALPASAAFPQPLTTESAGPPITLPKPAQATGRWIPGEFTHTPQGALAQLAAMSTAGLAGGDPATYARAYRQLSLPGAPEPDRTGMMTALRQFRANAGLPDSGFVAGLSVSFEPTGGLIKGTANGGTFAVVCVLGEFTVHAGAQSVRAGLGDCQAMRHTPAGWRISAGRVPAPAPSAWPGSADAVRAGYRELR